MKNFFFDTNILLDYLIPSNSFHEKASLVVKECLLGNLNGFVSAHSLTDIFLHNEKILFC